MPVTITFEPSGIGGTVATGTYLIDAAKRLGAPVGAGCLRGKGQCPLCVVRVNAGADLLSPPGSIEQSFLNPEQLNQSLRLACHAKLEGEGEVTVRVVRQQANAQELQLQIATSENSLALCLCRRRYQHSCNWKRSRFQKRSMPRLINRLSSVRKLLIDSPTVLARQVLKAVKRSNHTVK